MLRTFYNRTECVGNDVEEVNDILSQIIGIPTHTRDVQFIREGYHQVMFVSTCRRNKKGIIFQDIQTK